MLAYSKLRLQEHDRHGLATLLTSGDDIQYIISCKCDKDCRWCKAPPDTVCEHSPSPIQPLSNLSADVPRIAMPKHASYCDCKPLIHVAIRNIVPAPFAHENYDQMGYTGRLRLVDGNHMIEITCLSALVFSGGMLSKIHGVSLTRGNGRCTGVRSSADSEGSYCI